MRVLFGAVTPEEWQEIRTERLMIRVDRSSGRVHLTAPSGHQATGRSLGQALDVLAGRV